MSSKGLDAIKSIPHKGGKETKVSAEVQAMSRKMQSQQWRTIGEKTRTSSNDLCIATSNRERIVDQITNILEYRIDALIASRVAENGEGSCETTKTQIAGTAAQTELRSYVSRIVSMYRDVRYHNAEHAAHVTLSLNKMVEMMCKRDRNEGEEDSDHSCGADSDEKLDFHTSDSFINYDYDPRTVSVGHHCSYNDASENGRRTFGISFDPLAQLAVVFSALVHDVDHTGVSNRQLILEGDELALLYNDQSMAEQHSLKVAFSILLGPGFEELRKAMIPTSDEKFRFRKIVIDMLLCTDIGSPERMQIGKNKWREAFEMEDPPIVPVVPKSVLYGNKSKSKKKSKSNRRSSSSSSQKCSRVRRSSRLSGRRHSLDCAVPEADTVESLPHRLSYRSHMHLNDATIEFYPRESMNGLNKLRANAVLEQIMQAADVAHTMQSWETFIKWNSRLYAELYDAYIHGRGDDPSRNWYAGQIAFYDSYVLPLAKRLGHCGVFGEDKRNEKNDVNLEGGNMFLRLAQENRRRWELEGRAVSDLLARLAEEQDDFKGLSAETLDLLSEEVTSSLASSSEEEDEGVDSGRGGILPITFAIQYGARTA